MNQDQIKIAEVAQEGIGQSNIVVSDSNKVTTIINKVKEIPVKWLSEHEEKNFLLERLQDYPFLTVVFYSDDTHKTINGQFLIWPDGYICAIDVNSMAGNQKTNSYLSESKYPEIYQLLNDSTSESELFTQFEAAEQFVESQGYQIMMNSGANVDIQLPCSFDVIMNGFEIGDLLMSRNEISKQKGFDFSGYLGTKVTLITYGVESEKNGEENIDLLLDGNKIIGFWVDEIDGEVPDFNLIQNLLMR